MTCPGVTVVVPLYNKRPFIRRCLDSIATQSVLPDEVIVIDDGSTDGGPQIVADFSGLPIRLIHQENAGVSAARNLGIQEASHNWVAFLDADDQYLSDAIKNFRLARDEYPDASVVFGKSFVPGTVPRDPVQAPSYVLVPDYFTYLVDQKGHEINSSSVMVSKEAIQEVGKFPMGIRIGEDTDTWFRLGCLFNFARIDATLSIYNITDGESGWEKQRSAIPFWYATYETWHDGGRIPAARRRSAARNFEFSKLQKVIFLARSGQRTEAFRWLFRTIRFGKAPKGLLAKTLLIAIFPQILDWK